MPKHVPGKQVLNKQVPDRHVLGHVPEHVPAHVLKHVPGRHVLGTVLQHVPKGHYRVS